MNLTDKGRNLLKEFEGFRSAPYRDVKGVPTIGYGATHYANGEPVTMNDPDITLAQANELLKRMIPQYESIIDRLVTVPLNQNQYDALVLFVYNIGEPQFGKSTLLRLLNAGDYDGAAKQFSRWKYSGGKVFKGLVTRRAKEKALFLMKEDEKMLSGYKTYIGVAISILGSLSSLLGWDLGDLAGLQDQLIAIVGGLIAIYGRYVAKPKDA